jgi:hypothetical protein
MRRSFKLASVFVLFLMAVSLPALASPINGFSGATLSGISVTSASGSFAFSSSTDKFPDAPRSFGGNSMSEGVKVTNRFASGYSISEGSFSGGSFSDDSDGGSSDESRFGGKRKKWKAPEGGAEVTYLLLSGIAVLAGILMSAKQRRATRAAQSI